uniref:H(+)-transporting two-sector ATPase n=1 Tax=Micractinium conductrix TaxID=554055 RepID=A0A2I4S785_9CHLO|nr:ATP synthase F0 subunit 8 [Micractinium conductrix]
MPQLDKVTFLSQFFWLCFFYLGFYYIISKIYLPQISRILALRKKKLGFSQQGSLQLQQENHKVQENYDLVLSKAFGTSKNLFNTFISRTTTWLDNHAAAINKKNYQNANSSYVHSLGESLLSQNILFYHAEKNLPEKLTLKVLLKNLQNLQSGSKKVDLSIDDTKKLKKTKK